MILSSRIWNGIERFLPGLVVIVMCGSLIGNQANAGATVVQKGTGQQSSPDFKRVSIRVKHVRDIALERVGQGIAWSSDDNLIVCLYGFGGEFQVLRADGTMLQLYKTSMNTVDPSIGFTPRGVVTSVGYSDDPDAMLKLWILSDGTSLTIKGPSPGKGRFFNRAEMFSVSSGGKRIAAYIHPAGQEVIAVLDTQSLKREYLLASDLIGPKEVVSYVTLSPDGRLLAIGTASDKVFITQVDEPRVAELVQDFSALTQAGIISSLSFDNKQRMIASGKMFMSSTYSGVPPLSISELRPRRTVAQYEAGETIIRQITWSHNDRYLAAITGDQNAILVDLISRQTLHLTQDHQALAAAFSHDGNMLAVTKGRILSIFHVSDE